MPANTFGELFRITNWGESHGKAIGIVVDGCPSLLKLSESDIQKELDRRKPGQSSVTSPRKEEDKVEILSGLIDGKTTGAPISMIIFNKDAHSPSYSIISKLYRPSHADFTYEAKYGIKDPYGGGRTSARLTAGNVAAGAIARKILKEEFGVEIVAYVKSVKNITHALSEKELMKLSPEMVDATIVRSPDATAAKKMIALIEKAKKSGDSVGGVIECIVRNAPVGLGEPIFDKLEADLAKAMLSINATKGFEIGSGFKGTEMYGSEHNDAFIMAGKKVMTKTNNSGGVQGGISNGMPIVFSVAFKPTSTIQKMQHTVNSAKKEIEFSGTGRHDPCVLPRAVPIVEAMAALVLCDHYLRQRALRGK